MTELQNLNQENQRLKHQLSILEKEVEELNLLLRSIPPWGLPGAIDLEYVDASIPSRPIADHGEKWINHLRPILDKPNISILELGSRSVISNSVVRSAFPTAAHVGFDFHQGPNVDIVGDAHSMASYFDKSFDAIISLAVFEHLACPWIVAEECAKLLKPGGYVFVETHFSFSMHELPWHFYQFSHKALESLFNHALGFDVIESGVSNPIIGRFSMAASEYLVGTPVGNLYCHSGILAQKRIDAPQYSSSNSFVWRNALQDIYSKTEYPQPRKPS
jgi:SAM-dependent methyltransferase